MMLVFLCVCVFSALPTRRFERKKQENTKNTHTKTHKRNPLSPLQMPTTSWKES
jgi:hypothetical protein